MESPLANKVTSWPRRTKSSVSHDTIRSVPPYSFGGTLSNSGATCAILMKNLISPPKSQTGGRARLPKRPGLMGSTSNHENFELLLLGSRAATPQIQER